MNINYNYNNNKKTQCQTYFPLFSKTYEDTADTTVITIPKVFSKRQAS